MPEAWQHAVNHWLDAALAFSGPSLVMGYGVLVLALPLLLLPTAFPELSRPRDALWSLLLAALAPLLLMNRLPVFSSAGFGELMATVLMGRLATEVGQGRWESLTPDQRSALRHLPRWRRAGADVVAAVVQAAKDTWSAAAQAGKAVWNAVSGQLAMGASPGPAAENAPGAEPSQPVDGGNGGQGAEGAEVNLKDAATTDVTGKTAPEEAQRQGAGLVAMVVQAARNAWSAVSGQKASGSKSSVDQRLQGQSDQKTARKAWTRPDPLDGEQGDQGGEASPGIPDATPATAASPAPVVDHASGAEPPSQPADGADRHQGTGDAEASGADPATGGSGETTSEQEHPDKPTEDGPVTALVEDAAPEEHSASQPAEGHPQAEPAAGTGGDPNGGQGVNPEPGDVAPEDVERPVELPGPEVQPSEGGSAAAADPEKGVDPEPGDVAPEDVERPVELPGPEVQRSEGGGGAAADPEKGVDPEPGDVAPEDVERPVELPGPEVQRSEGGGGAAADPEKGVDPAPGDVTTPPPSPILCLGRVDPAPGGVALENIERPVGIPEPEVQRSEGGGAAAAGPEKGVDPAPGDVTTPPPSPILCLGRVDPAPGDVAPEDVERPVGIPGPEVQRSEGGGGAAANPEKGVGPAPGDVTTPPPSPIVYLGRVDPAPGDVTLEDVEYLVELPGPEVQPSERGGTAAAGPELKSGERAPEEPSAPEPVEGVQPAQPLDGADQPGTSPADSFSRDTDNSAPMAVASDDDPGRVAAADDSGEAFAAARADAAADTPQGTTGVSGVGAGPASPAREDSPPPAPPGADLVVVNFDEVDEKLWEAN